LVSFEALLFAVVTMAARKSSAGVFTLKVSMAAAMLAVSSAEECCVSAARSALCRAPAATAATAAAAAALVTDMGLSFFTLEAGHLR
jgi:hypothetical protein